MSLSFCVKDIVEGKVAIEDVDYIITGTKIENGLDWQRVVKLYSRYYWQTNPDMGREVATRLMEAGKLFQPRVWGLGFPKIAGSKGYWR